MFRAAKQQGAGSWASPCRSSQAVRLFESHRSPWGGCSPSAGPRLFDGRPTRHRRPPLRPSHEDGLCPVGPALHGEPRATCPTPSSVHRQIGAAGLAELLAKTYVVTQIKALRCYSTYDTIIAGCREAADGIGCFPIAVEQLCGDATTKRSRTSAFSGRRLAFLGTAAEGA